MSIIRIHKPRGEFTVLPKQAVNDERLTWEARGMLVYLLDKPDNWQVRFEDLVRRSPAQSDKTRRILHELETAGYISRRKIRTAQGQWTWESEVYETPQPLVEGADATPDIADPPYTGNRQMVDDSPSAGLPYMVKPHAAEPYMVNRQIYQNLVNNTEETIPKLSETDSPTQGATYVEPTDPPEPPAETDFDRLFKANLITCVQERWPNLAGGFTFAPSTLLLLRQLEASGPLLSGKAIDWALDQWEEAKPAEKFVCSNIGAVNWLLTTVRGYRANGDGRSKRQSRGRTARSAGREETYEEIKARYLPKGYEDIIKY